MRRLLIVAGLALLIIGLAWPWLHSRDWWRHLGHLPGDIHIEREDFSFHFPLMTCLLLSALASLLIRMLRK